VDVVVNGPKGAVTVGGGFAYLSIVVPSWATLVEAQPDPSVVTDASLRAAITATGLAWRVRDTGTQMEMLLVPPGTFQMGCIMGSNQNVCYSWEQPVHQVTLTNPFYLGRYEVTQAQWLAKMGSNPSVFHGYADSATRPVESVSWNGVQGYLSATGLRLATEAEWEYACRAGTQTPFYNGSTDDDTVGTLAWFAPNAGSQTHTVGGKAPNGLGLFDMFGNVWEWLNDWYDAYPSSAQTNPLGPASGTNRVLRGGSWFSDTYYVRSSPRYNELPGYADGNVGFRVARNP
jgi:formylglycine-generating enzyme required for sulfatase activity